MAATQPKADATLRLSRTIPAGREAIFRAWTDKEALTRWFAPSAEFETSVPVLELRPGGRYRVEMRKGEANHVVVGEYREVRPPERLVFTWRWEDKQETRDRRVGLEDTIVTVEFHDRGRSTELVPTHENFATVESRDEHNVGWNGCLDQLAAFVSERRES